MNQPQVDPGATAFTPYIDPGDDDFEIEEPTSPIDFEPMIDILKTIATSDRPTIRMKPLRIAEEMAELVGVEVGATELGGEG